MKSNSSGNASPCSILSSPIQQRTYLETEPEKVRFFCEQLKVPSHFLPAKTYHGQRELPAHDSLLRGQVPDVLGRCVSHSPVVTFTYIQGSEASMTEFVHHLEDYLPLFRQLSEFRFLYLARTDSHFQEAKELFDSLVTIPLQSDAARRHPPVLRDPQGVGSQAVRQPDRSGPDLPQSREGAFRRRPLRTPVSRMEGRRE